MLYDKHGVDRAQFNGIEQVGFLFSSCNGTQERGGEPHIVCLRASERTW